MRAFAITTLLAISAIGTAHALPDGSFDLEHVMPFGVPSAIAGEGDLGFFGITSGVMIVDLSDPASPRRVSRVATPGEVRAIRPDGDRLIVAAGEAGVVVVGIVNPAQPKVIRVIDTPGEALDVAVIGDWVFVADDSGGFRSLHLDPDQGGGSVVDLDRPRAVSIDGTFALVASSGEVSVIDIADPENMAVLGTISESASTLAVNDGIAYLGSGSEGLVIIDYSNPAYPVQVGSYVPSGTVNGVDYADDHVWLSNSAPPGSYELKVVDVANPSMPQEVGSTALGKSYYRVTVFENKVLVGPSHRCPVIDASQPMNPIQIGDVPTSNSPAVMTKVGSIALIAVGYADPASSYFYHVDVVDFSEPDAPVDLSVLSADGDIITGFAVDGSTVALLTGSDLVLLYDISDPSTPEQFATHVAPGSTSGVALSRGYLYLSMEPGIRIFDVRDPMTMIEVASFQPSWHAPQKLRVVGDFVYGDFGYSAFESWSGGFLVVDVSDPADPQEVEYTGYGLPSSFAVDGDHAYCVGLSGFNGMTSADLSIWDISSPGSPAIVDSGWAGSGCNSGRSTAVAAIGNRVIVAVDEYLMAKRSQRLNEIPLIDLGHSWVVDMVAVDHYLLVADGTHGLMTFFNREVFVDDFETGDRSAWTQ